VAAIYGRFLGSGSAGSEEWPNKAAIKAVIERLAD
jgi:hypothetical protein